MRQSNGHREKQKSNDQYPRHKDSIIHELSFYSKARQAMKPVGLLMIWDEVGYGVTTGQTGEPPFVQTDASLDGRTDWGIGCDVIGQHLVRDVLHRHARSEERRAAIAASGFSPGRRGANCAE
jgi:hypothetical protein